MTIRLKLTALFAALFIVLAGVLVAASYFLVATATSHETRAAEREQAFRETLAEAGIEVPGRAGAGAGAPDRRRSPFAFALREAEREVRATVLSDLLMVSAFAFAGSVVVATGLAYWLAGRVLRPIDDITRGANALSARTLNERLDTRGPDDELGRLKTSFNAMLARLETSFAARQRFAADASHELRTPLAVLEASADNVLGATRPAQSAVDLAAEVKTQVRRAESLIASLMALARADDVQHVREPLDLADITATLIAEVAPRASESGLTFDADLKDAPVRGDLVLLERMIANVLDNALRYNVGPGGDVACRVFSEGDLSIVDVRNSGHAVDPASVEHLFGRFNRGAERLESQGHGLGLAIVRRVAEVHGGTVVATAQPAGGLHVRVEIPRRG